MITGDRPRKRLTFKKGRKPSPIKYQFVLQEIFIMRGKKSIVVNSIWGLVKVEDGGSVKKTLWGMGAPLTHSLLEILSKNAF